MIRKMFAVVTGAQGGIGCAIVNRLLSDGFFVIAIDKTDRGIFSEHKNVINCCQITLRLFTLYLTQQRQLLEQEPLVFLQLLPVLPSGAR